jgi:hypothetical protein
MSAGYSKIALIKKLGIKDEYRIAFVYEPDNYRELLGELGENVEILALEDGDLNFVHAFYVERALLEREFPQLKAALLKDGMLWLSWFKKSSKMPTDLSGDIVRQIGLDGGLVDIKIAAIDAIWSAMKFVYRKKDR